MAKIEYKDHRFSRRSHWMIIQAEMIIQEYMDAGYQLTLRQLYYQFVARDLIENTLLSYKRLGNIMNEARLAGLIDWDAIEDRTRNVKNWPTWNDPGEIIATAARQFRIDKWADQDYRIEVWIEKEALAGVMDRVCRELQINYLSCRGYTSQSEMHASAMRLKEVADCADQQPLILHFGDHDPSGLDMTRDIIDRMRLFIDGRVQLIRMALNMDQIEQWKPPPNPAKITDSRFASYLAAYGTESWELDALDPKTLAGLVRDKVESLRNQERWNCAVALENSYRDRLNDLAEDWEQ